MLAEYQNLHMISTIRGQLSDYCAAIKTVTGRAIKIKVAYKEFAEKRPLVQLKDILKIIEVYRKEPDELSKLFSFFLYLLALTGARNETIRTVRFDQFIVRNKDRGTNEYILQTYASKTAKSDEFIITEDAYKFVQEIKAKRQAAMDKIIKERGDNISAYEHKLIKRRRLHLFTFYS